MQTGAATTRPRQHGAGTKQADRLASASPTGTKAPSWLAWYSAATCRSNLCSHVHQTQNWEPRRLLQRIKSGGSHQNIGNTTVTAVSRLTHKPAPHLCDPNTTTRCQEARSLTLAREQQTTFVLNEGKKDEHMLDHASTRGSCSLDNSGEVVTARCQELVLWK